MKTLWITALVGLGLIGSMDSTSAQRGGRDYGYDEREDSGRGRGRGEREYNGRGTDEGSRTRELGRDYEERAAGFDEEEYLRCYPDVRRAVERGEMDSGAGHYERHGRSEGRSLTCATRP